MNDEKIQFRDVENLRVYGVLCDLHLQVWEISKSWPRTERFELTSQVLRSSNSAPAQLAEKNADRHLRNRIEGVNRARGEAAETVHHLLIAHRKLYINETQFNDFKTRYSECIRILAGLERNLERSLPHADHKYTREPSAPYPSINSPGYPESLTSNL